MLFKRFLNNNKKEASESRSPKLARKVLQQIKGLIVLWLALDSGNGVKYATVTVGLALPTAAAPAQEMEYVCCNGKCQSP